MQTQTELSRQQNPHDTSSGKRSVASSECRSFKKPHLQQLQRMADESPRVQNLRNIVHLANNTGPVNRPTQTGNLRISQPHDPAEIEANRIAETIVSTPDAEQTSHNPGNKGGTKKSIYRKKHKTAPGKYGTSSADSHDETLSSRISGLHGKGSPLPDNTRQFFENRLSHDFSDVRVHTDNNAGALARSVNARAFTTGNDIVFAGGQYAPDSTPGKKLLAHELTHVVQQGPGIQRDEGDETEPVNTDLGVIPLEWVMEPNPDDLWAAVYNNRLCILPSNGSIVRIVPPQGAVIPENPLFTVPTIGKEGLRVVNVGNRTGFQLDAGGNPAVVFPRAMVAIQSALNIESISGVAIIHIHRDHVQSFADLVRNQRITPENIYFPEAFAVNMNAPGSTFARAMNILRTNPDFRAFGHGENAGYRVIPTPQGADRGFFHQRIIEGEATFDFYGLNGAFQQTQRERTQGASLTRADQASLLTRVTYGTSGIKVLFIGDLRGRDLLAFRSAMGEANYNNILNGVTVISGFQHHLGSLSNREDRNGLIDFITRTYLRTGSLTIIGQSQQRYRGNQFTNRSLIEALNNIGIDVYLAMEPSTNGQIGMITPTSEGNVRMQGGGTMQSYLGGNQLNYYIRQYTKLCETENTLSRYGRFIENGSRYATQSRQARQILEQYLTEFVRISIEGTLTGSSGRSQSNISPQARQRQQEIVRSLLNRTELEIETRLVYGGFWSEIQALTNYGPYLEIWEQEVIRARQTGRMTDRGIEALRNLNPDLARRLLGSSQLSNRENRRIQNRMPWRSTPAGTRAVAGILLLIEAYNLVEPVVSTVRENDFHENVREPLIDILWWYDKGVMPNIEVINDHWFEEDEITSDYERMVELLNDKKVDYLALTGIDESYWPFFMIWLKNNIINYRDWYEYFNRSNDKTIKYEGSGITDLTWFYRQTTIKKELVGYSVEEEWVESEMLTRIMNATARDMVDQSNRELRSQYHRPGKAGKYYIAEGAYLHYDLFENKPQATGVKRFRSDVTNPKLYTLFRQRACEGFSTDDVFYTFPHEAVENFIEEVPPGYVVVGGATYNTYMRIYLSQNDRQNFDYHWTDFHYNTKYYTMRPNGAELLLANRYELEDYPIGGEDDE